MDFLTKIPLVSEKHFLQLTLFFIQQIFLKCRTDKLFIYLKLSFYLKLLFCLFWSKVFILSTDLKPFWSNYFILCLKSDKNFDYTARIQVNFFENYAYLEGKYLLQFF